MVSKKTTKKKTIKRKVAKRKAGRKAQKAKLPGWILLLGGVLFGLIIAIIGYMNGWVPKPDNPNSKPVAQTEQVQGKADTIDDSADLLIEPPAQKTDDFDFYETLQDMEVVIDKEEIERAQNRAPSTYFIQLGAFRNITDAETLKAKIAFTGKTAIIHTNEINQKIWHRVRIGPYNSSRKADVDKRKLEKNNFTAVIIKQK